MDSQGTCKTDDKFIVGRTVPVPDIGFEEPSANETFSPPLIGVQQLGPYDEMHLSLSTTSHLSMTTSLSDMCSASLAASFTHFHGSYSA